MIHILFLMIMLLSSEKQAMCLYTGRKPKSNACISLKQSQKLNLSSCISSTSSANNLTQSARQCVKAHGSGFSIVSQHTTPSPCMVFCIGYWVVSNCLHIRGQLFQRVEFSTIYDWMWRNEIHDIWCTKIDWNCTRVQGIE